ncbi:hypothetical protein SAMN05421810_105354 [Amycolatopsis arida]|uniref:Uncharacterized protein n=1 Tax=Amycolatopsis arida TaxID=587909 RepID=A0A1I5WZP9_9PSEU|nr:hypothetical protein CLV69_105373 [Amycolatopsis arida]SFQ25134.1 hypothetical protein SAMN05421810_105354 [Amycolatopsis arida]
MGAHPIPDGRTSRRACAPWACVPGVGVRPRVGVRSGWADLWDRNRIRGHLHLSRAAWLSPGRPFRGRGVRSRCGRAFRCGGARSANMRLTRLRREDRGIDAAVADLRAGGDELRGCPRVAARRRGDQRGRARPGDAHFRCGGARSANMRLTRLRREDRGIDAAVADLRAGGDELRGCPRRGTAAGGPAWTCASRRNMRSGAEVCLMAGRVRSARTRALRWGTRTGADACTAVGHAYRRGRATPLSGTGLARAPQRHQPPSHRGLPEARRALDSMNPARIPRVAAPLSIPHPLRGPAPLPVYRGWGSGRGGAENVDNFGAQTLRSC